jgi:hypothetical protein
MVPVSDMKVYRWYQNVEVTEVPENDTWTVLLDGRWEDIKFFM